MQEAHKELLSLCQAGSLPLDVLQLRRPVLFWQLEIDARKLDAPAKASSR